MSDPDRLRILSLNTWGIVWPIGKDVIPRAQAIGRRFNNLNLDVVALQEVWSEKARDVFREAGAQAGLVDHWSPTSPSEGGGLLVLSRLPIKRSRFIPFQLAGIPEYVHHADYWGGKGFAILDLEMAGGTIHVLNTHLQASYRLFEADQYIGLRTGQIVQMASNLRELSITACRPSHVRRCARQSSSSLP